MDDLIVKVTVDLENVALGDVISTADLHCRQLTQSTKSKNQSVFMESLKEIVRVEHSYTVRGNVGRHPPPGHRDHPHGLHGHDVDGGQHPGQCVHSDRDLLLRVHAGLHPRCPVGRESHQ